MSKPIDFTLFTPVLASLDIKRSVAFFCAKLGFIKTPTASCPAGRSVFTFGPAQIVE